MDELEKGFVWPAVAVSATVLSRENAELRLKNRDLEVRNDELRKMFAMVSNNCGRAEQERDEARAYAAAWKRAAKLYRLELLLESGGGIVVQYRYRPTTPKLT